VRYALAELQPQRLALPGRYGQGVSFGCPLLHTGCVLEAWFLRPDDGLGPNPDGWPRYQHSGGELSELSLSPAIEHGGALILVHKGRVFVVWVEG